MAEVILAETTLEFESEPSIEISPSPFILVEGEKYLVVWNGVEHECVCVLDGVLYLTDFQETAEGATGNFIIGYGSPEVTGADGGAAFVQAATGLGTYTVAIYTAESSEFAPNDIILKRYSGEEKVFKGVDVVRLTHASNEYTVPYTFGEAVENIPITLDLKDGDQTVTAPEGTLVKSAVISKPVNLTPENIRSGKTIAGVTGEFVGESEPLIVGTSEGAVALDWSAGDQIITPATDGKPFSPVTLEKPATLLPENIAKDINIAGIIGTFAGGGAATIKCGQIAGNNTTSLTINHYLFSVPDLFFIYMPTVFGSAGLNYLVAAFGISQKLYDIVSAWGGQFGVSIIHDGDSSRFTEPLTTTSSTQALHHATTTQITVGRDPSGTAKDIYTFSGTTYYWIAIGGLT